MTLSTAGFRLFAPVLLVVVVMSGACGSDDQDVESAVETALATRDEKIPTATATSTPIPVPTPTPDIGLMVEAAIQNWVALESDDWAHKLANVATLGIPVAHPKPIGFP